LWSITQSVLLYQVFEQQTHPMVYLSEVCVYKIHITAIHMTFAFFQPWNTSIGNFIELGVRKPPASEAGKFGTSGSIPSGFFGRFSGSGIGMVGDADGFNTGADLRIDYFLPGTPAEEYYFGYGGAYANNAADSVTLLPSSDPSVAQIMIKDTFKDLEMTQVISLGVDGKLFRGDITFRNKGTSTLTGVRYMRSHDPDNTVSIQCHCTSYEVIDAIFVLND